MRPGAVLAVLVILASATSPARCDWLVTRASGRVETKGPWKVKSKLVVFHRSDGSLSSLRLADVDLEASAKATAEAQAKEEAPQAPQPAQKKLAVLTDKDFRRPAAPPPAEPAAEDAKPESDQPAKPQQVVTVTSWQRFSQANGLLIQGTLQNNSDEIAAGVGVEVQLYDEVGDRLATAHGVPGTASIQPRGAIEFRASFPGVFSFAEAKFETRGFRLNLSPAAESEPAESSPPK
jgi:hypothetical protein